MFYKISHKEYKISYQLYKISYKVYEISYMFYNISYKRVIYIRYLIKHVNSCYYLTTIFKYQWFTILETGVN